MIITLILFALLIRDITPSFDGILFTINSQGKDTSKLDLKRNDELGVIGRNLFDMLDNIKTQQEIKDLSSKLAN